MIPTQGGCLVTSDGNFCLTGLCGILYLTSTFFRIILLHECYSCFSSSSSSSTHCEVFSFQRPLFPFFHNLHSPPLIQAPPPGLQNRPRQHRVRERRQPALVDICGCRTPGFHLLNRINEFLEWNVPVSVLASKIAGFVWCCNVRFCQPSRSLKYRNPETR